MVLSSLYHKIPGYLKRILIKPYKEEIRLKTSLRWLILIAGILMIGMGIWFIFSPLSSFVAITILIGGLLFINGIFHIIAYFSDRKHRKPSGWLLADGILTALIGLILMFDIVTGTATLTFMFAFWIIFSGVLRIMGAFAAKEFSLPNWGWILALGTLSLIIGFFSLFHPIVTAIGIVAIIGTLFIIQGINAILTFFYVKHIWP